MSDPRLPPSSLRLLGGCHLDGLEGEPSAVQVKRLALLAYLACTTTAPPTRERLCSLFWPEHDQESARHSLRQSLYALRQLLGADVIRNRGQFVTIDEARLEVDVIAFMRFTGEERHAEALALYAGDLLDGVHVSGAAPEFEGWLDGARQRLRALAVESALREADANVAAGRLAVAERNVQFAESLQPLDERLTRRRMVLLAELGNRGAALDCYAQLAARLRGQLEVDPSDATQGLARDLSAAVRSSDAPRKIVREGEGVGVSTPATVASPRPEDSAELATASMSRDRERLTRVAPLTVADARDRLRRRMRGVVGAGLMVVVAAAGWRMRASRDASMTTGVAMAKDLVARGSDAFCAGTLDAAASLFAAAVAADTSSADAAFGQSVVAGARGRTEEWAAATRRALQLTEARPSGDRLRLLVRASWAEGTNDRTWLPLAESLSVRYPGFGAGRLAYARALVFHGDFASARDVVREAALRVREERALPMCRRTELLSPGVTAALLLDSLDVAEREVREWLRRDPGSTEAHYQLATILQRQGRSRDALRARQASLRTTSAVIDDAMVRAEMALRDGHFTEAEALLAVRAADVRPEVRSEALWWLARLQRERGRARDAVETTRALRAITARDEGPAEGLGVAAVEAQALLEAGQFGASAQLFDSLANAPADGLERELPPGNGIAARRLAWALAHVAAARAAEGDTLAVRMLADSIRTIGAHSAFGRDQRLHHHVLGELLIARGDTAGAIRELQLAMYSSTEGYSRTSLVLARLLTARRQGREAATILEAALRAPLDGSAMYTTRTELQEALAYALVAAGRRDEARRHFAIVATAWQDPDPALRARARQARRFAPGVQLANAAGEREVFAPVRVTLER